MGCSTNKLSSSFFNAKFLHPVDILRHLLQYDFIVDLVNHVESINGRSPLHFAAMLNHVEIAKVLLEHGGNITKVDITERSPLYIAAYRGHAEMLDLFLENGKVVCVAYGDPFVIFK